MTSEELLCGVSPETKTAAAENLIRRMLSDGNPVPAEDIFRMAESQHISRRTVNEAKKNIPELVTRKEGKVWLWIIPK